MARFFAIVLALCGCLAVLPAAAAPGQQAGYTSATADQPGATNPDFMGMVIRDPWYDFNTNPAAPGEPNRPFQDAMGQYLANIGVRWVRLDFHIPVGYTGPADQVDFEISKNDYFIFEVAPRYNLKVLALLSFDVVQGINPRELNTGAAISNSPYGGGVNIYMQTWLDRALRIADRYRGNIAGYEVLNEQNRLPQYAGRGPAGDAIDPTITGRLLTKFYRFCKNIDPTDQDHGCNADTKIILGGIHPRGTGTNTITMTDAEYLTKIYSDPNSFLGFKNQHGFYPVDGIGYHPYPQEIKLSPNDAQVNRGLARMRAVLNDPKINDLNQQFWITEVGYNVGFKPSGSPVQTEAGQAAFMRDVYTTLPLRPTLPNGQPEVANVFWFKFEDFPPASSINAQRWGVAHIAFTEGGSVNGAACPGGACYNTYGIIEYSRQSYLAYRELAGLPPIVYSHQYYFPVVGR